MVRLIRKAVILGLAAFGAYRLYELVKPAAEQVRPPPERRDRQLEVRRDAGARRRPCPAKDDVVDDIKIAADDQQQKLTEAAHGGPPPPSRTRSARARKLRPAIV